MSAELLYHTKQSARRLKIAIVAHLKYPIAEPFSGGLEMHTHLLASKLTERGHDVTLYAAAGSDNFGLRQVCHPTALLESDPEQAGTIVSVERRAYVSVVDMLRRGCYDLIHCNALHSKPLREACTLDAPMVVALHTPPFPPFEASVVEASGSISLVAVSASLATVWSTIKQPIHVIGNGIDLTRFRFNYPAACDRSAFWSGRIVPEKGLHHAIDAASKASIDLKIAGPICDRAYWHRDIKPRLNERAVYLGHLSQADLAERLGMASVAICTPCWEEPFGLVVIEALACGTPVAGFARGALPYILDASCGSLAAAGDVDELALAIQKCLDLDRRACRVRAETHFDAEHMVDQYEALYRAVAVRPLARNSCAKAFDGADA